MLSPATAAVPAIVPPVPSSASLLWIFLVMACISPKTVQKYRYCLSAQYLTCRRPRARCQGAQMTDLQPFPAKLTARQQQILDLIQSAIARTGAPPTRAEIAAELGFKSANAAEEHLQALARKGVIELVSGTSRGIRLCGQTVRNINAVRGTQFSLPIPGLSQLTLPLIGRVAAGSPILAQEHVDQTYTVEGSLFAHKPDDLLKVRGMSMRDAGIMDGDLLAVDRK